MFRAVLVTVTLYADILVFQLGRRVAEEAEAAMLAVLPPGIVLAADTSDHIQEVDKTAPAGMAVTLAIAQGTRRCT